MIIIKKDSFLNFSKVFFVVVLNLLILYTSYLIEIYHNLFISGNLSIDNDYCIRVLIIIFFIYSFFFNVKNMGIFNKSLLYRYSKISVLVFFFSFSFASLYYTLFAILCFPTYFLYILLLNILYKNKKVIYYFTLLSITLMGIVLSFISLTSLEDKTFSKFQETVSKNK